MLNGLAESLAGSFGGRTRWLMSPRARATYLVASVAVVSGSVVLPLLVANRQPDPANLMIGLVLVLAGADLLAVRTTQASGALLVAAGVAWFVPDYAPALPGIVGDVVARASLLHLGLMIAAVLAYPRQGAASGREVAGLAAAVAVFVSGAVGGYRVVAPAAGVVVLVVGLRQASLRPGPRRGYYLAALAFLSVALIGIPLVRGMRAGSESAVLLLYGVCLSMSGVALALAGDWRDPARVMDVGADGLSALDPLVAGLTGDPDARVVVRTDEGRWVGLDGVCVVAPHDAGDEPVRIVSRHRARPTRDLELALDLAGRTVRRREEARIEGRQLELLRHRWATVEDDERSALEDRLRVGPLASLDRIESQLLDEGVPPELLLRLRRVRLGVETLARGLDPLGGLSLPDALTLLAREAGGSADTEPVELEPAAARALWFACSEALANVGKHAPGSRPHVQLASAGADVVLTVVDEAPWAAEAEGRGLRDLEDRLAAFDGSLGVDHLAGRSTVTVRVPRRISTSQHGEDRRGGTSPRRTAPLVASDPPTTEVEP